MNLAQPDSAVANHQPGAHAASPRQGVPRRWPFYVAGIALFVLAIAWIDGGEEPLHPIAQAVDLKSLPSEAR